MGTFRIYRRLQDLTDVDPAALPLEGGAPVYRTAVSSFVIETVGGGGGSDFSAGVSSLGNTLGDTGITGTRLVLAGVGRITLSQSTDAAGGTVTISGGTAAAGAFSAGLSNLGNTDGTSGMTGTQMVFAGGNNVTLSQANDGNGATITISGPNTVAQSVQTQNRFNLTLDGNTAGVLAEVSSGTLTLAGGSNITVSQNGNAISIIGQSGAAETQTAISGIANSQTTYTSGTVNLSGLGAITVRSTTGQAFQLSVAAQSVQPETQTFLGGLVGSNATYTSGTVSIIGSGDITVSSGTGQRIIIFGSQSVQPETQTFVGGVIASDTTYTSGSIRFTGVGGGVTVSSNTGQRVDISVAAPVAQSVQPGIQNLVASNTTFSSGTVSISGFGDVTVNTAANIIRISAPVQTAESQSIGMSNVGNTSGTTGVASGAQVRFLLAGGNNVTLSQSLNGASGTLTISAASQTVQTQNMVAVTLSGNTSGAQALISSGTLTLAGGNNITVSQAGNAITISGPNVGGAQTGISGIIASDATYTSGTVQFTGSNMITVKSSAGQRVVIDATQSVQPGVQNIVASDATFSSGTVSISGFGAATVNTAANLIRISVPTQSVQPETQTFIGGVANTETTYTSGTVKLLELGAITVRSTTGNQFQLSVNAQTVESQSIGMSNVGNTSGTTGVASGGQVRFVLAGGNNITLSQSLNGASGTVTISAPNAVAQTNQSLGMYAVQNTTGQSSSTTMDARTLSIAGDGAVSVGYSAGSLRISAPTQTVESQSLGMSNVGNTSGTTGVASGGQVRFVLAGGNNITLSQSLNGASGTITISGGAGGGFSAGVSNVGNTSGDTGITGTRLVLAGGNNITVSQSTNASGGTVTISAPNLGAGAMSIGVSTGGNTAGATGITGTQMVLVGSGVMSLSQTTGANGGTVSILAPATSSLVGASGISISTNGSTISVYQTPITSLAPYDESPMVTGLQGQGTLHVAPFRIANQLQMDRVGLGIQVSNATNSSGSFTLSQWFGVYTKNASSLSLVASTSISTNFSGSGTAGSYSLYAGPGWLTIPWTTTLPPDDYYAGIILRSTTAAANHSISQLLLSKFTNSAWSGIIGVASATSVQRLLGQGHYSATTSAFPGSIAFTQIIGSASIALRCPVFHLRSGTV